MKIWSVFLYDYPWIWSGAYVAHFRSPETEYPVLSLDDRKWPRVTCDKKHIRVDPQLLFLKHDDYVIYQGYLEKLPCGTWYLSARYDDSEDVLLVLFNPKYLLVTDILGWQCASSPIVKCPNLTLRPLPRPLGQCTCCGQSHFRLVGEGIPNSQLILQRIRTTRSRISGNKYLYHMAIRLPSGKYIHCLPPQPYDKRVSWRAIFNNHGTVELKVMQSCDAI